MYYHLLLELEDLLLDGLADPSLLEDVEWYSDLEHQLDQLARVSERVRQKRGVPEKYTEFHAQFLKVAYGFIVAAGTLGEAPDHPDPEALCECSAALEEAIREFRILLEEYVPRLEP